LKAGNTLLVIALECQKEGNITCQLHQKPHANLSSNTNEVSSY
jgi:hypothetical protein